MHTVHRLKSRLARKYAPAQLGTLGTAGFEGYASLRRRGPMGVRMLYQHFAHEPIGVWDEVREDSRGLYVRGSLTLDVERARDVMALMRDGALGGLSIGFKTQRARRDPATGVRTLLDVDLWEISAVTFPLLPAANVTAVGGSKRENIVALAQRIRTTAADLRAA